jgi:hypothetical protein
MFDLALLREETKKKTKQLARHCCVLQHMNSLFACLAPSILMAIRIKKNILWLSLARSAVFALPQCICLPCSIHPDSSISSLSLLCIADTA